jgi:hypothetical protein
VLGTTPLSLALPQDGPPRVLLLEKPGYEPYLLRQPAARGQVHVRAALVAKPEPVAPGAAATEPSRPAPRLPPAAVKRPPAPRPAPSTPPRPSDIRLER